MSIIAKATNFALSNFSPSLRSIFRSVLPLSIKRFLGKKVMKDVVNDQSTVVSNDGRIFKVIEDRLFLRVVFEKDYEPLLSATAIKIIKKGDNIVDIGANFGWYSTLFCKLSETGKVICYEPAPHSFKILDENIALNQMESRIDVRKVGVGAEEGSFLMEPGSVSESGLAHVVTDKAETTIEVPVVTLDNDLSEIVGQIDYMKMDIEGFEYYALKGAQSILSAEDQPILQIELNDEALERSGSSRKEIVGFLEGLGYTFYEATPNSPGNLQISNTESCSDVFCFGKGKHSQRLKNLLQA